MKSFHAPSKLPAILILVCLLLAVTIGASQAVQHQVLTGYTGDAYADLVVGVPGENVSAGSSQVNEAGMLNVIYGAPLGLDAFYNQTFTQDMDYSDDRVEAEDQFGAALASGDFNGDRLYDVAVGVPFENITTAAGPQTSAGAVHVIYGAPSSGLSPAGNQFWHQDSPDVSGSAEYSDHFGSALAAGNFNGDEYDDLAIGIPLEDFESASTIENAGSVIVLYGSVGGLSPSAVLPDQMWYQGGNGINDQVENHDWFGYALASGDFDDDGYDDLAVGAPGEDSEGPSGKDDIGVVHVLYGSSSGLSGDRDQQWEQYDWDPAESEANDRFGKSLAAGKFRWITHDALAIGVPDEDIVVSTPTRTVVDAGAVNILYGSASGLKDDTVDFIYQDGGYIEETAEYADHFGQSLAAVDFNGNGIHKLVVGVPDENLGDPLVNDAGAVHVLTQSSGHYLGADLRYFHQGRDNVPGELEPDANFGFSLAPGDFNGDGKQDLGIGVPFGSCTASADGAVAVIYDDVWGSLADIQPQRWCQGNPLEDIGEADDHFGTALAALPAIDNPLTRVYLPISIRGE